MHSKRSSLNRRQFFARSAVAAGATSLGGGLFDALVARAAFAGEPQGRAGIGYGPLRPAGEDLALPAGFQYRVISNEGDPMEDGFPTPKAMDGMATFAAPNGNILLIRNHEDGQAGNTLRPRPAGSTSTSAGILERPPGDALRSACVRVRHVRGRRHRHPRSRAPRPARSREPALESRWHGPELRRRADAVGQLAELRGDARERDCYGLCSGSRLHLRGTARDRPGTPAQPVALSHLGRFAHEAVAVDPATGAVYETEDQGDGSGFYRFMPSAKPQRPGDLAITTGTLQMLKVVGAPGYETAINQAVGVPLPVEWVTITNPDPVPVSVVVSGATFSSVFVEGLAAGGARFRRLEGCWYAPAQDLFHFDQRREHGVWSGLDVRPRGRDDHAGRRIGEPRHVRRP